MSNYNVYILRNGERDFNGVAVVVAQSGKEAKFLVKWDYDDKTTTIKCLDNIVASGPARVEFQNLGD